jgi:DNA polymerase (family 10)
MAWNSSENISPFFLSVSSIQARVKSGGQLLTNAEIADRLASLAQMLSTRNENPYRVRAYRRAAAKIRTLSESLEEFVRNDADLTAYADIGAGISSAIREIVLTGTLGKLERIRSQVGPELAALSDYPRLDPARVLRIYKKLRISSVDALREKLESSEIEKALGSRMAQHVRQGLTETHAMLLHRADNLRAAVEEFLLRKCGVRQAVPVGDYRRRVELVEELVFMVDTKDFAAMITRLERYGGRTPLLNSTQNSALYALAAGIPLRIHAVEKKNWGSALVQYTGSERHLRKLAAVIGSLAIVQSQGPFPAEETLYGKFGLSFIEPELREGYDEVERAAQGTLPSLVTAKDLRGELHAHSSSSDGSDSIEQMAVAARDAGYQYIGITDHSRSLKIARGVSAEDLWKQIRFIDALNGRFRGIRVLKAAEVDILADGTLDYSSDSSLALYV